MQAEYKYSGKTYGILEGHLFLSNISSYNYLICRDVESISYQQKKDNILRVRELRKWEEKKKDIQTDVLFVCKFKLIIGTEILITADRAGRHLRAERRT